MRAMFNCLLVVVSTLAVAQSSSQDLHNRFGDPDRERFMARPGISLSVQYGSDGLACFMLLESPRMLFNSEQAEAAYYAHTKDKQSQAPSPMDSKAVTQVLEDVVPVSSRGTELNQGIRNLAGTKVRVEDFENVIIMHFMQPAFRQESEREERVTVLVKRLACSKQTVIDQ
jgi:hypothetical protein